MILIKRFYARPCTMKGEEFFVNVCGFSKLEIFYFGITWLYRSVSLYRKVRWIGLVDFGRCFIRTTKQVPGGNRRL